MASFRLREGLWDRPIVVLTFLLPAILVPHLLDLGYWRADFEILAIGGGSALVGLALAIVEWRAPRIANFIIIIAVNWLFDVYFDETGLAAAGAMAIVAFLLLSRFSGDIRRMLVVFSCFWLAANLLVPGKPLLDPPFAKAAPLSQTPDLPPIVHIVLDEQMSLAALPGTIPPGSPAHSLIDDYLDRGFTVFTRAISSSPWTKLSLSQLVSFSLDSPWAKISLAELGDLEANPDPRQDLFTTFGEGIAGVSRNRYFEKLHELGYAITTIQSVYLKFCSVARIAADDCHTYLTNGHGHTTSLLSASAMDRLVLALDSLRFDYLNRGRTVHSVVLAVLAVKATGVAPFRARQSRIVAMLSILDQLGQRLRSPEPGRAHFVHLLLPHEPFVLDEDCAVKDWREWAVKEIGWTAENAYPAYWEQVSCTHRRIMALIDQVQREKHGKEAIFIVHGDHGSRISFYSIGSSLAEDGPDMLETFLAIKMPGTVGGQVSEPVNLQETFARSIDELMGRLKN